MDTEPDDGDELSEELAAELKQWQADSEYIYEIPAAVPPGKMLVHNHVVPHSRKLGRDGFRAWLANPDPEKYVLCSCDWASELGWHYRVRKIADSE